MIAKFEDPNAFLVFVGYVGDEEEIKTDYDKKENDYRTEGICDVGWYIVDTDGHARISDHDDYQVIYNPYKSFNRIIPILKTLGKDVVPAEIEIAYSELLSALAEQRRNK
jgi:hypothetical protein